MSMGGSIGDAVGALPVRADHDKLREALRSIALNTCCDRCQEAALVAQKALGWKNCERCGKNHYDMTRPRVPGCPFTPARAGASTEGDW